MKTKFSFGFSVPLLLVPIAMSLALLGSCDDPEAPDSTPPQISIVAPSAGAVLTEPVLLRATASDNIGVAAVSIFIDGDLFASFSAPPYEQQWDVSFWADGQEHEISASARDEAGNAAEAELISVTVAESAQNPPQLIEPAADSEIVGSNYVSTRWRQLRGAERYLVQIALEPSCAELEHELEVLAPDSQVTTPALAMGQHFWRARGANAMAKWSAWSEVRGFTIKNPAPPTLLVPFDEALLLRETDFIFSWTRETGAVTYAIQIAASPTFADPEWSATTSDSSAVSPAQPAGAHYWRVRAKGDFDLWGQWSETRQFTVSGPPAPILLNPPDAAPLVEANEFLFRWHIVDAATEYEIQIAGSPAFVDLEFTAATADTSLAEILDSEGLHYWRVRSRSELDIPGAWSLTRSFTVAGPTPPPLREPEFGAVLPLDNPIDFRWRQAASAVEYEMTLALDPEFASIVHSELSADTSLTVDLSVAGAYFWRVRGRSDLNLWGEWSSPWNFSLALNSFFQTYGDLGSEAGRSMALALDGGYVITGVGQDDLLLIKTDPLGVLEWERRFGAPGLFDEGLGVVSSADGGYVACGYTSPGGESSADLWLLKVDAFGDLIWDRRHGGIAWDEGTDLLESADGGYVVTGVTYSNGAGLDDAWLVKTDAAGNALWQQTYGGSGWEMSMALAQAGDGGYALTGYTRPTSAGADRDLLLIRTNPAGDLLWSASFGGGGWETGFDLKETADGGWLVVGATDSYGAGDKDLWLLKISANGALEWERTHGGGGWDLGFSLAACTNGWLVTGGTASSGEGLDDLWLLKLDAGSELEWSQTFGGISYDLAAQGHETADGGYVAAGSTSSFGAGGGDVVLVKTGAGGEIPLTPPLRIGANDTAISPVAVPRGWASPSRRYRDLR